MKLLIASDIHGDIESANILIEAFEREGCDKILLLGDVLYHGPRNDLPGRYAPKEVISLLNGLSPAPLSVRGNCEAEVDQMVLNFPVLADYALLAVGEHTVFATHGHHYTTDAPPPLRAGDVLLHGHTHLYAAEDFPLPDGGRALYLNPGSVALPKENNPRSYMVYEKRCFSVKDFDGNVIFEKSF